MATREQLMEALRKADAAGDVPAARAIARQIQAQSSAPAKPATRAEATAAGTPRKERTGGEQAKHVASFSGRKLLRGVASIPEFVLDSALGEWSPGRGFPMAAEWAADKMGLDKPETPGERVWGAGVEAAGGSIGGGGLRTVAKNVVSGLASGMAGQSVAEMGGGTTAQIAANLVGGAAPSARDIAKIGVSKARSVVGNPAERAAAELSRNVSDKARTIRRLERRKSGTPFTRATTAEAAGDQNLAAFERSRMSSGIEAQKQNNAVARREAADAIMGEGNTQTVQDIASSRVRAGETRLQMRERLAAEQRAQLEAAGGHRLGEVTAEGERALMGRQGQADADLARVQAEQDAAIAARQAAGETELQARQQAVHPELISREQSAMQVRPEIQAGHEGAKNVTREMYDDDLLKHPTEINMKPQEIKKFFNGLSGKVDAFFKNAGGKVPRQTRNILNDMLKELDADNLNTATIQNVDRRLADFAGKARVQGGGKNSEAAFAEALRDEISRNTAKHIPADVAEQLALAKGAKRLESETFGSGTQRLGPIIEPKRYGFDKIKDTELARRLVTSGDAGGTLGAELKAAIGHDSAERLVAEEMRRLVDEGVIKSEANMLKYKPVLDQFPGVGERVAATVGQRTANKLGLTEAKLTRTQMLAKQKLAGAAGVREQEVANRASIVAAKAESAAQVAAHDKTSAEVIAQHNKDIADFKASPLGKAYGERTDPTQAIHDLLNDKSGGRSIDILVEQIGKDPDGIAGVRRALGEYVRKSSAGGQVNAANKALPDNDRMRKAIEAILDKGDTALTKDQKTVLEQVHAETGDVNFAKNQGVLAKTYGNQNIPGVSGVAARTLKWALTKFGNEKGVDRLIEQALMNPHIASELLKRPTDERRKMISRAVRAIAVGTRGGMAATDSNAISNADRQMEGY